MTFFLGIKLGFIFEQSQKWAIFCFNLCRLPGAGRDVAAEWTTFAGGRRQNVGGGRRAHARAGGGGDGAGGGRVLVPCSQRVGRGGLDGECLRRSPCVLQGRQTRTFRFAARRRRQRRSGGRRERLIPRQGRPQASR